MNCYKFRILLPLTLFWSRYLPEEKSEWINIKDTYDDENYEIKIGMEKETVHADVLGQLDIPNQHFPTKSIWLYIHCFWAIEFDELEKVIQKDTSIYHNKITFMVKKYYQRLIEIIRTQFGQYWINPTIVNNENLWNSLQLQIQSKEWVKFFPQRLFLESRICKDGKSKDKWKEMEVLMEDRNRIDMVSQMLTNAKYYLTFDNGGMAVVEACAALEAFIKQNLPPLLGAMTNSKFDENDIDKSIKKLGFSHTTNLFFKYFANSFQLNEGDTLKCLELIEIRNNVIHNKARYVKSSDAKYLIDAVVNIINCLSH